MKKLLPPNAAKAHNPFNLPSGELDARVLVKSKRVKVYESIDAVPRLKRPHIDVNSPRQGLHSPVLKKTHQGALIVSKFEFETLAGWDDAIYDAALKLGWKPL